MPEVKIKYPPIAENRGALFWIRPDNLWASRRKLFRSDNSTEWRYSFGSPEPPPIVRSTSFSALLNRPIDNGFRFIILGDTGEGDKSQYSLLPLIRALQPDFMIINGDVAYPAGEEEDFLAGFFEPYRDLGIPIWAVPGNHEYYSSHKGEEFFEIFCTNKWATRWQEYGLRLVKQPGTYWELKEASWEQGLVVIGVDTGMGADLDGNGQIADKAQHEWLDSRLRLAQEAECKVIVLFHIPALRNQEHDDKTHIYSLHHLLASYSCVRLVVGAHYHNHQQYAAEEFRRFLDHVAPVTKGRGGSPHYFVSGGGGAYITSTDFKKNTFPTSDRYPPPKHWRTFKEFAKQKFGSSKNLFSRVVSVFVGDPASDPDLGVGLSLLMVEVKQDSIKVFPVFLDNIQFLFDHLPLGTIVNVQDENPPVSADAVNECIQEPIKL
jgi:3',5'-cyclic AMP phosphodiesterase CpdA